MILVDEDVTHGFSAAAANDVLIATVVLVNTFLNTVVWTGWVQ